MSTLYLDPFSGLAGDMFVGALIDLGASFEAVERGLAGLGVEGYSLSARRVLRAGIAGTKFEVDLGGGADPGATGPTPEHHHRGLAEIRAILDGGGLADRVRERALATFELLADAEARVHDSSPEEVHFHEVGAVDAICDVVGAALALEELGVERLFVGPLRVGSGFVKCAHGTMPVPAPGALACLAGFDVRFEEGRGELVTPTGAALVGALAEPGPPEAFMLERVGYGAGTRDPADVPNLLRAALGSVPPESADAGGLVELSTNLDHLPPTVLQAAAERVLAAGARDVFVTPCTMKKGRPGHLLVALAAASLRDSVERAIFEETGTLGVRRHPVMRTVLERSFESAATPWGSVRVKLGVYAGRITSRVPEFEDCRALADRHGVPVERVIEAARVAAAARADTAPGTSGSVHEE